MLFQCGLLHHFQLGHTPILNFLSNSKEFANSLLYLYLFIISCNLHGLHESIAITCIYFFIYCNSLLIGTCFIKQQSSARDCFSFVSWSCYRSECIDGHLGWGLRQGWPTPLYNVVWLWLFFPIPPTKSIALATEVARAEVARAC